MNWLAENALPIWMGGAIALTMAAIVYSQTRSNKALGGVVAVVLVTAALLVANRLMETPREAVERTLYELASAVEANDVKGALRYVAPTANAALRKDVETLMPLVRVERARVLGALLTEMSPTDDAATVKCRGFILAVNKKDGMKGAAEDHLVLQWIRNGDRWLLESYTSQKNWNSAVGRPKSGGGKATQ